MLARSIGTGLRREGMAVDVVLDGAEALERLALTRYDVVVLDRDLPGVHGDDQPPVRRRPGARTSLTARRRTGPTWGPNDEDREAYRKPIACRLRLKLLRCAVRARQDR